MEIHHFGHEAHPLRYMDDMFYRLTFYCCDRTFSSDDKIEGYGCEECNYYIHKACSEIPTEINHFYHPNHPLKLYQQQPPYTAGAICAACSKRYHYTLTYRCTECPHFQMDTQCALLPYTTTTKPENVKQIHYPYHGHPLTLCESPVNDYSGLCLVCYQKSDLCPTYRCDPCGFVLHEACSNIDIPQELYHYFHACDQPLILAMNFDKINDDEFCCEACKTTLGYIRYECLKCQFYMDVRCALLPNMLKQKDSSSNENIEHFTHGHPLKLCDDYNNEKIWCSSCKERPEGRAACYECDYCPFFLHKSCIDQLPRQIETHPLHPAHGALSLQVSMKDFSCYACRGSFKKSFGYKCSESCDFILDLNCASLKPSVKFESHTHLLTLITSRTSYCCNMCNELCGSYSEILRCIDCDYNLHLQCGPLPCIINGPWHVDPLKLMDHFVEDYDDADNFYCDICEQARDPRECVYYCKDCNFIAEIGCVMDEVLYSLKGGRGNVRLRTTNKSEIWTGGRVISSNIGNILEMENDTQIDDIQTKYSETKLDGFYSGLENFFTVEERDQVYQILHAAGFLIDSEISENDYRGTYEASSYSDEEFKKLIESLDSFYRRSALLCLFQENQQVVEVGNLAIFQELAPFLKGLLHEYDDFTAKSSLGPRPKMFFLTIFCSVVDDMCMTNVREVDEELLHKWWKYLKAVKHAEFEIQFAMDRLHKITQTFFGLQAKALVTAREHEFDILARQVKNLEDKLEAKRLDSDALKLQLDKHKNAVEYPSSLKMKDCNILLSEFETRNAWDAYSLMLENFTQL